MAEQHGGTPPHKRPLSPVQLGGCIGAAATCLAFLGWNTLSRPPGAAAADTSGIGFLTGVWCVVGGMAGMAVGALLSWLRRGRGRSDAEGVAGK